MHAVVETSDSSFFKYWDKLCANDPVQYLIRKQHLGARRVSENNTEFTDRSFLVVAADEPIIGCSITMHLDERGRKCIGYFGREASSHINESSLQNPGYGFRPEAIHLLQEHINHLLEEIQPHSVNYLDPVSCGVMSPVTQVLLEKGAIPKVQKSELIDLTRSKRDLFRGMTKSCRGMVDWGRRNLDIEIKDVANVEASLNSISASSSTAPSDSASSESLLEQGNGILVLGRYREQLVSRSLFAYEDNGICRHLSSENLDGPIDRPLLHGLIWEAMLQAKKMRCRELDFSSATLSTSGELRAPDAGFAASCFGGEPRSRLRVTLDRTSA